MRPVESMDASDVRKIAVIGAGTMGAGIAQACAAAGFQVAMRDIEQRFVDGGFRRIREPLAKRVEKGKMTSAEVDRILSKIRGVVDLKEAVAGAQVVIEAVFEKMDIKRDLYSELDRLCPPDVVFASNTSSLSITEMANATKRADRVIGMHFFNPAPVMKLVEVIRGSETSDATVALVKGVCAKLGKDAVDVVGGETLPPDLDIDVGVEVLDGLPGALRLVHADAGSGVDALPLQVADVHGVEVDDAQPADPGGAEEVDGGSAQAAGPHHEHPAVADLALARLADLRQDEMP